MEGLDILYYAFLAIFKFALAVPAYIVKSQLPFVEAFLFASITGISAVVFLVYLSSGILRFWRKVKLRWCGNQVKPLSINRNKRRLVQFRQRYGLWGLSLISPVLLSLPVGCLLAVRYYHRRWLVIAVFSLGILWWSLVFAAAGSGFHQWMSTD